MSDDDAPQAEIGFQTTHWSVVVRAGRRHDRDAQAALATLCERYWLPVYAYYRRRTRDIHEAQDWTQAFFAWLLEKNPLACAAPERGRFRAFLLTAAKNFLANQRDRASAQKRGGGVRVWQLDMEQGEARLRFEAVDDMTPERHFERQWVLTLLELVMRQLETEYHSAGRGPQFDRLKETLTGQADRLPYAELAAELGMTEGAARQAASRLRKRYRELLRTEILQTLAEPGALDDEIRSLFELLGP